LYYTSLTARSDQAVVLDKTVGLAAAVPVGVAETQIPMVVARMVALMTRQQQQLVLAVLQTPSFGEQQTLRAVL
jgi:hypothetical protein